ncbi:MAG: 2-isopropylmalate synthase [Candidatus Omnitrophica bacterium]|nr:2-isopropylmalate synthase [Candidatus Omnitrophota bacterium]
MSAFELLKHTSKVNKWRKPKGEPVRITSPDEPELLRDIFPYTEVPRITFDGKHLPVETPEDVWITCTTFRDGQQARPPYTVEQIVDLYSMMHRLGGPKGIIRQSEFFLYSDKDKEAVHACLEKSYQFPQVTGWIRATEKDFQLVKDLGLTETGILTSASDYHIFLKLRVNREKALDQYLGLVKTALDAGVLPRCHFEDITRADIYGFIIPFAQRLMELGREANVPIKIRLCDTMGYGVPFAEASLPRSVPKLVHALRHDAGVPSGQLEWHGHNDFHMVLANGVAAWLYGASALNGALLGFGERCGNPPIEGACMMYASLKGSADGMDLSVITEISDYYKRAIKAQVPPNYPFVGDEFNTTRAGIHADGVIKNEEIYNIFDTTKILNRKPGTIITDKSGLAGIAFWMNTFLGLKDEKRLGKHSPGIIKIHQWVDEQYQKGRTTGISTREMIEQIKLHLPEYVSSIE